MKRLLTLLLLSALPCAAQISYPPPCQLGAAPLNAGPCTFAKIASPISNTGNSGANTYLAGSAIKIPAGVLGANSIIRIEANFQRASGTGNCTGAVWLATTSGSLFQLLVAPAAGSGVQILHATVVNANSLSAQNDTFDWSAAGATGTGIVAATVNTANDTYINASENNSVSTDSCQLVSEVVTITP